MTCLLGVCDVLIPSNFPASSHTNKIGGIPNWPENIQVSIPSCQVCNKDQFLVVQLYCCLEKSKYHRTLYVFACRNSTCWNSEQSWTVFRCQSADSNQLQSRVGFISQDNLKSDSKYASNDLGVEADDWGDRADDWGDGADDWGDATNHWGEVTDDWSYVANERDDSADDGGYAADDHNSSSCDADVLTSDADVLTSDADVLTSDADVLTSDADVVKHLGPICSERHVILQDYDDGKQCRSDDGADCLDMKQLSLHATDDDMAEEKSDNFIHVLAEDMPSLKQEKLNTSHNKGPDRVLESYFINVFEEPSGHVDDNHHIAKLIENYQKREGCNVKEMLNDSNFWRGGKMEKYEKTDLLHNDFMFHKFIKRLSACPEQCIRYKWSGSELFISIPSRKLPSRSCCHCGGEVVFELQLTPALINHLRFPDQTGPAVEFGTVLVYTCKKSCWDESDSYRLEYAVVQSDPDQHLFRDN